MSFPSLGKESCLGHLGLPGKGVALLGQVNMTWVCSPSHLLLLHMSEDSLVGGGRTGPSLICASYVYLPRFPLLSRCPQSWGQPFGV